MVKTIYWKAGKSGVAIAAFVSMVEMDGTAKSQVKVMNLDDGSSFFLPLFIYMVQFLLILLIIRFPPWQQIFKHHHIVFNMDM